MTLPRDEVLSAIEYVWDQSGHVNDADMKDLIASAREALRLRKWMKRILNLPCTDRGLTPFREACRDALAGKECP